MSNSALASYKRISPNRTSPRKKAIDTITIHCIVGQWTAKQGCDFFSDPKREASANYVVGKDGSIGLCVEEKDRAWTTGGSLSVNGITGSMNDQNAVTIEVASDTTHPYAVTAKALSALIALCADIAKRNGIKRLLWRADKSLVGKPSLQNMTVHRWFANKACPGDYLYQRMGYIADEANKLIGSEPKTEQPKGIALQTGDEVEILPSAVQYYPGSAGIPAWVKNGYTHTITQTESGGRAVIKGGEPCVLLGKKTNKATGKTETGIRTWVAVKNLKKVTAAKPEPFAPYRVRVTVDELNIRKGPGTNYNVVGAINDKGIYTIVLDDATAKWGKLKSGAGWICLEYTKRA